MAQFSDCTRWGGRRFVVAGRAVPAWRARPLAQLLDQLRDNRQLLVHGGCGTGKIWHAVEQAFRYASSGKTVLFLVYNLRDVLEASNGAIRHTSSV